MEAREARDRGELLGPARAPERDRRVLPVENPTQSKMDDALSVIGLGEPIEPVDGPKILLKPRRAELWVDLSQVVAGKLRSRCHAAGEETPAQRPVSERGNALVATVWEDVLFDRAFKQVVGRLYRLHRRHLAEGLDLRRTEIADADEPDLAGALKFRHRRRRFLNRHVGIGPVHLIEVDDVGAETSQRIVNFFMNASLAGVAERLSVLPVKADLGGDDDVLTPSALGQRLAHDLLRAAEAIGWRGIDQSDATIDRLVDDADRRRFVSSAPHPSADRPCAEADARNLEGRGEMFDLGAV